MLKVSQLGDAEARVPARQALDTQIHTPSNLPIMLPSSTLPSPATTLLLCDPVICLPAPALLPSHTAGLRDVKSAVSLVPALSADDISLSTPHPRLLQGAWDPRWRSCLSELSQTNVLHVSLQPGALAVLQSRHQDDERTGQGTESEQLLFWEQSLKGKELQILKKPPLVFRIRALPALHTASVPYSHPDRESDAEQACTNGVLSRAPSLVG